MLLQYDNLAKMDTGRNIITIPLNISQRVWGILNIQEMPFEKYNFYSERILQIIASLAEHSIEKAVAYESIIRKEEVDERTGLPLFSQFFRTLEEEVRRAGVQKSTFSIILVELTNYDRLLEASGSEATKEVVKEISDALQTISDRKAYCFHYKEEYQLALLIPGLDIDGVSLFSLETLEKINTGEWKIRGEPTPVEAAIGFSIFSGEGETADQLLEQAENLLEMQRV
jgi:GGDEF domain-containing protein